MNGFKVRATDPACMRPTVANCTSVRLDMALLVNTTVGDQVQLPQGPSLKLVRRAENCAVFQVLTHIYRPCLWSAQTYCTTVNRARVGLKLYSPGLELQ